MRIKPLATAVAFACLGLCAPYNPGGQTGSSGSVTTVVASSIGNGYINAVAVGNTIVISLLATGGGVPTPSNPVVVRLRSALNSGVFTSYAVTAANTFTISAGSSLGCAGSENVRIHVGLMGVGGNIELFAWTATLTAINSIYKPQSSGLITTTAEGGTGGADSAQTLYSAAARVSAPWIYAGYLEIASGAAAGTWSNQPSVIVNWQPGVPLPGETVGLQEKFYGNVATGTGSTIPYDNTKPQIGEGDQYMDNTYIPLSPINKIQVSASGFFSGSVVDSNATLAIFVNGAVDSVACTIRSFQAIGDSDVCLVEYQQTAGAVTPVVVTARAGCTPTVVGSKVIFFNGLTPGATNQFDGLLGSFLNVYELQA